MLLAKTFAAPRTHGLLLSLLLSLFVYIIPHSAHAQNDWRVQGTLVDSAGTEAIIGATVLLISPMDTLNPFGAFTDGDGKFEITNLKPGPYQIRISFVGYKTFAQNLVLKQPLTDLGKLKLKTTAIEGDSVVLEARAIRAKVTGDTVQFMANAYKTNPDANVEDLVSKMPGITIENGTIKTLGENVEQILVDGKPFFGDDIALALRNLPANAIASVQVYDKPSEQAALTGFDDGRSIKTLNIITKPGNENSLFGKTYGGYGTDNHYIAGASVNSFTTKRRISLVALSNNINQQNFSIQDISTLSAAGSRRPGGPGGPPPGGGGGAGGPGSNFMVGPQSGVATTHTLAINYSESFGKKIDVNGSYFLNFSFLDNLSSVNRAYFAADTNGLNYAENNLLTNNTQNHRLSFKVEYRIDSAQTLTWTPNLALQFTDNTNTRTGTNTTTIGEFISSTEAMRNVLPRGLTFSHNLVYTRKLGKPGRTISVNLGNDINNRSGKSNLYSTNLFYNATLTDSQFVYQNADQLNRNYGVNANISYTEPLNKSNLLQFSYQPNVTWGGVDRSTWTVNRITLEQQGLDTTLTSYYKNDYMSHTGGLGWRHVGKKYNFMLGADYQYATLNWNQSFPSGTTPVARTFHAVLPSFMMIYKISPKATWRVFMRSNTNAPSAIQLQNIVNNTNPLQLSSGNAELGQSWSIRMGTRYAYTNPVNALSFFAFGMVSTTRNYIGSQQFIARRDTVVSNGQPEGVELKQGAQYTRPINLDGYFDARLRTVFGAPIDAIRSNINLTLGGSYNRTPGLINDVLNYNHSLTFTQGITLASNISEKLDFNISYNSNYTLVSNSVNTASNNNYFFLTGNVKLNWMPWRGFVLNTTLDQTLFTGLSSGFNQNYFLWSASLGYKFLKDRSLEVKATVFDILNQNNSIGRAITAAYVEDSFTQVLNRYALLTVTYTFIRFGGGNKGGDVPPSNGGF